MKRTIKFRLSHLLVLIIAAIGCGKESPPAASRPSMSAVAAADAPTDAECLTFAQSLEATVKSKDIHAINAAIDWDAIFEATTASLDLPDKARDGFKRGAKQSVSSERGLAAELVRQGEAGGSYRFLRLREKDGRKTALFRAESPAGINYHECVLGKTPGGVKATDIFVFLTGEYLTTTMRRAALPMAQQMSRTWLEKLTTAESVYAKNFEKIAQIPSLIRERRPAEALAIYAQLPPELQKDKTVLLMRYQAAMQTDDQELIAAIEDFRRYHPTEACLDFILVDYHAARREWDQAIASIDRLDEAVGGDPYLNVLRANLNFQKGDKAKAYQLAELAMNEAGDIFDTYWLMISATAAVQDYDQTLAWLRQARARLGLRFEDLTTVPAPADFARSPQGQAWTRINAMEPAREAR